MEKISARCGPRKVSKDLVSNSMLLKEIMRFSCETNPKISIASYSTIFQEELLLNFHVSN